MTERDSTPFEKALTWHRLGKGFSPNAESVKHVDAILAEIERVNAERQPPDPALVARLRSALEFGEQRKVLAVPIDVLDVEQLLALLEPKSPAVSLPGDER